MGIAAALAVFGAVRGLPWADAAALLLVAGTFVGVGVFLAPLGLEELYAFVGVGIFTTQVTRFRAMVRPFLLGADESRAEALRSLYLSFLQRLGFLLILVVLISLILYVVATVAVFPLGTEITAFLLGLAVILAFLVIARLRS